jgi:hypothetical protein
VHTSQLGRLKKAVDRRDEILETITNKLLDLQQLMSNHGTQLRALYDGRRADVAPVLQDQPQTKVCSLSASLRPRATANALSNC